MFVFQVELAKLKETVNSLESKHPEDGSEPKDDEVAHRELTQALHKVTSSHNLQKNGTFYWDQPL